MLTIPGTNVSLDQAHADFNFQEGELTHDIWYDKYRYGQEKDFSESAERFVNGVFAKDISEEGQAAAKLAREFAVRGLLMPAGRIMAGAGTDKWVTLLNCFHGDELFVTREHGLVSFVNAPSNVTVLTAMGWMPAEVKSFGEQITYDITLIPRTIDGRGGQSKYRRQVKATRDHRWLLQDGLETTNLQVGDRIRANANLEHDPKSESYRAGFKHGFVFGDGHHSRTTLREVSGGYPEGTMHFDLRLCGKKAQYLDMFKDEKVSYHPASNGDPTIYMHTMTDLKAIPSDPIDKSDPNYIVGFIEGWNAADGSTGESQITGADSIAIFSKDRSALNWLANYAPYAGYAVVGNRRYSSGKTNYGGSDLELWVCTLRKAEKVTWEVESIEEYYNTEVYCAVVPGEAAFTLAGGIYTGNCFVNGAMEDSMKSIMNHISYMALTMQMGGGDGTYFGNIRPFGARLKRTGEGSKASGPLPFIESFSAVGRTIRSAGDRRGAQMWTISDTHPDLLKYVHAKNVKDYLTEGNMSINISDAFMEAKDADEDWALYFHVEPAFKRPQELIDMDFDEELDEPGTYRRQYVYSLHKARAIWEEITRNTYEYSEPGIIYMDRVNELNNLHWLETINCTNPCVTGDTLILTDKGHLPIQSLVGKETTIWNGWEWSKVTPFPTGVNPTLDVTFSNGQTVQCTPYHKWVLTDGQIVEARDLKIADKLVWVAMPVLKDGINYDIDAYSQGFYCGDGTKNATESNLYKHSKGIQGRLVGKLWDRNCEKQPGMRWRHGNMYPKDFVPLDGSLEYCLNWLAGLLDADGCLAKKSDTAVLEISAKNRNFLRRVGLMLNRLGVNYRIWERADSGLKTGSNGKAYYAENTAALMISAEGSHHLYSLGMRTERVDLNSFKEAPRGKAHVGHRVISVVPNKPAETYCFNEPLRNTGIFNGTIGHNCGEQPLPPHNACDLGHVVLARMVKAPFTDDASFDFDLLRAVVRVLLRFLDNVWDVTKFPLKEQEDECLSKRRTGLGYTGLADVFAQMGYRYGSARSADLAERIEQVICEEAYSTSIDLAIEKGSFPLFDADQYLAPNTFAGSRLPRDIQERIRKHGIRNGVLLTIAPTGTSSIVYGNPQGGLEPFFACNVVRKVRQEDDSWKRYINAPYSVRLWAKLNNVDLADEPELPAYFNSVMAGTVKVEDHILIQSRVQRWVDASISKTTNIPKDMPYEDFVKVYDLAYTSGCKGCTTYRPSDIRGSVLEDASVGSSGTSADDVADSEVSSRLHVPDSPRQRTLFMEGSTYQIKWPRRSSAMYITINGDTDGVPFEVFITGKDGTASEWTTALSLMITGLFRKGGDTTFVADELKQIQSAAGDGAMMKLPTWEHPRYIPSLPAYLGHLIEYHMIRMEEAKQAKLNDFTIVENYSIPPSWVEAAIRAPKIPVGDVITGYTGPIKVKDLSLREIPVSYEGMGGLPDLGGTQCPSCKHPTSLVRQEGCDTCLNGCGYSHCG